VCGVNLIQLKRWYGRRVPHFRRLSLKSKVTQKLVNACRLTLQCPAAGKNKGVNGSQAGGKLSFYCLWRVLNFRWHCTLTHEANCLTARGAVYVCTRVLLMEIGQIIKCGSSLDPPTSSPAPLPTPPHLLWGAVKPEIRLPSLPSRRPSCVCFFPRFLCWPGKTFTTLPASSPTQKLSCCL